MITRSSLLNTSPFEVKDFVSKSELEMLRADAVGSPGRENKKANIQCSFFDWPNKLKPLLIDRLRKILGRFDESQVEGNYFSTPYPYIAHVDTGKDLSVIPYKVILIPLDISPGQNCGTVFFHQRYHGLSANFSKGFPGFKTEYNQDLFSYDEVENLNADVPVNDAVYEKYLTHIPKSTLQGFTVEKIVDWQLGSAIVFDRCQIHCATDFRKNGIVSKSGLSIFTRL